MQIKHYIDQNGRSLFDDWFNQLQDVQAKIAIDRRIIRMQSGNFGDFKPVRDGVWELRINTGPGYRIYYSRAGADIILLLCGGDKNRQNADIDRACACWRDWQQRRTKP